MKRYLIVVMFAGLMAGSARAEDPAEPASALEVLGASGLELKKGFASFNEGRVIDPARAFRTRKVLKSLIGTYGRIDHSEGCPPSFRARLEEGPTMTLTAAGAGSPLRFRRVNKRRARESEEMFLYLETRSRLAGGVLSRQARGCRDVGFKDCDPWSTDYSLTLTEGGADVWINPRAGAGAESGFPAGTCRYEKRYGPVEDSASGCGAAGTVRRRIADCAEAYPETCRVRFSSEDVSRCSTVINAASRGTGRVWKLVSRVADAEAGGFLSVLRDEETGLLWTDVTVEPLGFDEAVARCEGFGRTLGLRGIVGRKRFALPTRTRLETLDYYTARALFDRKKGSLETVFSWTIDDSRGGEPIAAVTHLGGSVTFSVPDIAARYRFTVQCVAE